MTEKILILDFGSQYTQLIARRVREFNVYCEIIPFNKLPEPESFDRGIYWIDIASDAINRIICRKRERYKFTQYFQPYMRPHIFSICDRKDIKPFIKRCLDILKEEMQNGMEEEIHTFSWEKIASDTLNVYSEVLENA